MSVRATSLTILFAFGPSACDVDPATAGLEERHRVETREGERPNGDSGRRFGSHDAPIYRVPVRVHAGESQLRATAIETMLLEANVIWAQAGICFEFEVVAHDQPLAGGFDVELRGTTGLPNGQWLGDHDIWVAEVVALTEVDDPAPHGTARTMAHELGHALDIWHTNGAEWGVDRRENLMASGTAGWHIPSGPGAPVDQIEHARTEAALLGVPGGDDETCSRPRFFR